MIQRPYELTGYGVKQAVYKPLGFVFLALGLLGIPLPILPSTPFILLAAWFFARSSRKWHDWLLDSELFGPIIMNWEENRCLAGRTKVVSIAMMLVAGSASIGLAMEDIRLRLFTAALLLVGCATVLSIKTCRQDCSRSESGVTD